ncbi:MAG TPA: cytochrome c3 family protein [Thermoanaerobaculia bacterium]|nr:cytochrome c3 family protein [Thermoanaerobaculia bacterium]
MSQLFDRSSNALARTMMALAVVLAAGGLGLVLSLGHTSWVTRQNLLIKQPIQFSHDHHVGQIGISCGYCHTAYEQSSSAGIPPTATCMNCHSQIWAQAPILEPVRASWRDGKPLEWVRVHDLPEFVYFDHSIHVAKGVGCETCHGRIDEMAGVTQAAPLTMSWCLDCHRDPVQNLRPRAEVTTMGWKPPENLAELQRELAREYDVQSKMSCSTCHR